MELKEDQIIIESNSLESKGKLPLNLLLSMALGTISGFALTFGLLIIA